ncbi:sugar phosphate isomerase/epimerase [Mesorhizobium sp. MSK_1335]|uniref:Sugar phosphate isomerase/epimerase n=1 Tax=Mesorhizobium montanum TaxID=3072323 RepID=A0ABU4ZT37_9HYPH|nr:sugar phosphate isomerase/epimerase [Mesorhizobium sp. MSK_1335]MDX8528559.1 sugar phosphate isomerase/epimerase [Mesorhizobium sp. MSK_1335]
MAQKLAVLQSLWAMERRHTQESERSLEANIAMIASAGYAGISTSCVNTAAVRRIIDCVRGQGMVIEGMCFPATVDDLKPCLELATEMGIHHLDLQPDVRPRTVTGGLRLIEGWRRLAEQVDFPVLIETHRDRMTTDLYFVLDLLDQMPDLPLLADLSHFLVGREFAWPVSAEHHEMIHRVLDNSWALHGRVASREQVQIEISFPHHRMWLDLFLDWWRYGVLSWRRRAEPDATLCFTCELGPKPYSITGRDGNDTTNRWEEALTLKAAIEDLWTAAVDETAPVATGA